MSAQTSRPKAQSRRGPAAGALLLAALLVAVAAAVAPTAGGTRNPPEQVSTSSTNGNGAFGAFFTGASEDGTRVFFRSEEQLASTDTDSFFDIYERTGTTTTEMSIGPAGGNGFFVPTFRGASADGKHVFFDTNEPMVSSDTDVNCENQDGHGGPCVDVWERFNGATSQVSTGPTGGNGSFNARFGAASADGTRVFFTTREPLVAADTDSSIDVYERSAGTTALVSTGPSGGNGAFDVVFKGISRDGAHAFFETGEQLVSGDTDGAADVYERSGGTTTLVSTGPSGGNGAFDASYRDTSSDGSRVYLETPERLTSGDTDSGIDVYVRSGGTTTLVSTGPSGGNGTADALYEEASNDGSHVFFQTSERLVSGDTDSAADIYDRSGGTTTLVSTGPSGGNGTADALFQGASRDGVHAFFGTTESLVPTDTDGRFDLYDRSGATTALVSTGPAGGNGASDAFFRGTSDDGTEVFFETYEALTSDDTDSLSDVYERAAGTTTRISTGAGGGNGSSLAVFQGATPDGSRVFFGTGEQLAGTDTDSQSDLYVTAIPNGYPRPKGATPAKAFFVIAYKPCATPNRQHGQPLGSLSCNPPVQTSDYLTVGTLDANQEPAQFSGSIRFDVRPGNPSTPADDADVDLAVNVSDVRRKSDLSDYQGELLATTSLRITDKLNGSSPVDAATVADLPFSFAVPCTPTADTGIGSSCAESTTADALVAGIVPENVRSIWQLGQIELFDGGADGDATTTPNTLFADEGYFVP